MKISVDPENIPITYRKRSEVKFEIWLIYIKFGTASYSDTTKSWFLHMMGADETYEYKTKQEVDAHVKAYLREFLEECINPEPPKPILSNG